MNTSTQSQDEHISEMRETMEAARQLIGDIHVSECEEIHKENCRACRIYGRLWDEYVRAYKEAHPE